MQSTRGFGSLGRLVLPFLLIVCALVAGLGWLGWRVLEQDRALERQRIGDRLGTGADLVATALVSRLAELDDRLVLVDAAPEAQRATRASAVAGPRADGALILRFGRDRVNAYPASGLLYYPLAPRSPSPLPSRFARGEFLEYRKQDYAGAAAFYRGQARSGDPAIRSEALVRLARTLRKANRPDDALAIYKQLEQMGPVRVDDVPADLIAGHARCVLLEEVRRPGPLRSEAAALHAGLEQGRWQLTEGAYRFYLDETHRWLGAKPDDEPAGRDARAIAECASALWQDWQGGRLDGDHATGRRSAWFHGFPLLLVWRSTGNSLVALVATATFLERQWFSALQPTFDRLNLKVALTDTDGHPVHGAAPGPAGFRIVRPSADTGLPWVLHVATANLAVDMAQLSARRRFVLAGFGLTAALIAVAGYVTTRAVARELEVARLQSDFVSAVSHEFRTPLATLRQLSELLADGRVQNEERRNQYYEDLRHESERLHRLVENLLDFGRMEAGRQEYRFDEIDAAALVRRVAGEFAHEVAARGCRIEVNAGDDAPGIAVRADQEALARALWNLLDNAVKYSPDARTVRVDARADGDRFLMSVRDEGLGISADEQRRIFDKFVRGASAAAAGVKGTGLGLAMVQHIVAAHGGDVRVASETGKGSTFTIALPIRDQESGIRNQGSGTTGQGSDGNDPA
jgi:signal transduction histidine kinase